jgi:hypothetical protein
VPVRRNTRINLAARDILMGDLREGDATIPHLDESIG